MKRDYDDQEEDDDDNDEKDLGKCIKGIEPRPLPSSSPSSSYSFINRGADMKEFLVRNTLVCMSRSI